jgi:DNA-binding XRE family transcriptional regulator
MKIKTLQVDAMLPARGALLYFRYGHKIKAKDMAEKLGISVQDYYAIEKGRPVTPTAPLRQTISDVTSGTVPGGLWTAARPVAYEMRFGTAVKMLRCIRKIGIVGLSRTLKVLPRTLIAIERNELPEIADELFDRVLAIFEGKLLIRGGDHGA